MAEHWWRAYDSAIDHPKLLKLSDAMHRAWWTLQCIASANGGSLPSAEDIGLRLRLKPAKVAEWITNLVAAGLIDHSEGIFRPHNWDVRQYKTDNIDNTRALRQKKHREKQRAELNELKALRDNARYPLRNGVTNVPLKRPDTDTENITTTVSEDTKRLGNGKTLASPELEAKLAKWKTA